MLKLNVESTINLTYHLVICLLIKNEVIYFNEFNTCFSRHAVFIKLCCDKSYVQTFEKACMRAKTFVRSCTPAANLVEANCSNTMAFSES